MMSGVYLELKDDQVSVHAFGMAAVSMINVYVRLQGFITRQFVHDF